MSGDSAIWIDGAPSRALPLPDRGLDFGDGLFETLLLRGGEPLYPKLHLARLQRGIRALAFPDSHEMVCKRLDAACAEIRARGWRWSALRLTLTRGAGPRGYAPPTAAVPRIIVAATDLGEAPAHLASPAAVGMASVRWPTQPALAGLKHLNRLEQVLAAREYRQAGLDEAVMLDQRGGVVSVVAGNLFLVLDGQLLTAPVDSCGIAGTRRELIMRRWAPATGLTVREATLTMTQLDSAEEVFFSNSLLGLRPVGRCGKRAWRTHVICEKLFRRYQDDLA